MKLYQIITTVLLVIAFFILYNLQTEKNSLSIELQDLKLEHSNAVDSLDKLQKEYSKEITTLIVQNDSLVYIIDSLKGDYSQVEEDYNDLKESLQSATEDEIVEQFNKVTADFVPEDSTVVNIGRLREATILIYQVDAIKTKLDLTLKANYIQTIQIDNYQKIISKFNTKEYTYQQTIQLNQEYIKSLEENNRYYINETDRLGKLNRKYRIVGIAATAILTTVIIFK